MTSHICQGQGQGQVKSKSSLSLKNSNGISTSYRNSVLQMKSEFWILRLVTINGWHSYCREGSKSLRIQKKQRFNDILLLLPKIFWVFISRSCVSKLIRWQMNALIKSPTMVGIPARCALSRPFTSGTLEMTRTISAALSSSGLVVRSINACRLVPSRRISELSYIGDYNQS